MEPEFYESGGTPVAQSGGMARRVVAFIAMIAFVILVLLLMWQIHLHHESGEPHVEEPSIVERARAAHPLLLNA